MSLLSKILNLFRKPQPKETKVVQPIVDVTIINPKKTDRKFTIDEIVESLDKVQSSNGDVYTTVGLLVSEIKDVFDADSPEAREKQKIDVYMTLKSIEEQVRNM